MAKKTSTKKKAAGKKGVNKSQAIRDYLKANRNAGPTEVQKALAKKGIKVTPSLVSKVKSDGAGKKTTSKKKTRGRPPKVAVERGPVEDIREASDLMFKAVELVIRAGTKEAQQLVTSASEIVKKVQK